uniref:CopG-like protein n=1 Tax=Dulem virus 29 TaxID=3145747 RepID=A0AAU8AX99_9CAUD
MKKKNIAITIDYDILELIKHIAQVEGRSLSGQITFILRQFIETH